jgi:hypothetical protein
MTLVAATGRLADLYRRTMTSETALALVAANAIPLAGVVFLGWSLQTILVLYWIENGIVGIWNVPRLAMARGDRSQVLATYVGPQAAGCFSVVGRLYEMVFFTIHYGIFWAGHGIFVLFALPEITHGALGSLEWSSVAIGGAALFASHALTYFRWVRSKQFLYVSETQQMFAPYGRVVVLHLTIILGGFAVASLGAPVLLLVVLVAGKTILDLRLHFGARTASAGTPVDVPAA